MNKYQGILSALLVYFTLLTGCKKDTVRDYSITNNINKVVTLDIYTSAVDYANNSNLVMRKTLQPNETTTLAASTFKSGSTYYMDYYTDDFGYNNWFNLNFPADGTTPVFHPSSSNTAFYVKPDYHNANRAAFLNGNQTSTTWVAIGAYLEDNNGYVDEWASLGSNGQYRQLTIRKDFNAIYSYKDASGNTQADTLSFLVHNANVPYLEFINGAGVNQGSMIGSQFPDKPSGTSTDSMMVLLPNSEMYFLMVRQ